MQRDKTLHRMDPPRTTDLPQFKNVLFGNQHTLLLPGEQRVLVCKQSKLFIFQDFSLSSCFCTLKVVQGPGQSEMICVKERITRIICHFWFVFEFEK